MSDMITNYRDIQGRDLMPMALLHWLERAFEGNFTCRIEKLCDDQHENGEYRLRFVIYETNSNGIPEVIDVTEWATNDKQLRDDIYRRNHVMSLAEYVEHGCDVCPKCLESRKLSFLEPQIINETNKYEVEALCRKCGTRWVETYTITKLEII